MTKLQRLLLWLGVMISPLPATCDTVPGFTGLQSDVVFSDYNPLSSSAELVHRLLSPLNAVRVGRSLAHSAAALRDQPIDLARERFTVYVPSNPPSEGYGLLVFVPPGTRTSAEDSFGVATFEEIPLGDVYADLADRLLAELPAELRQAVSGILTTVEEEKWPTNAWR